MLNATDYRRNRVSNERVALVTGASSGFGMLTATMLRKKGLKVFGTSRMPKQTNANGFEMLQLNIDSDLSTKTCVSEVVAKAGRLDVLINNAGYAFNGAVEETSGDEAKALFETNFFGAVRMTEAVLPAMRQRRSGQIVNVGSLAGTFPVPFDGFYAAAKAALLAYSEALRYEVGAFGIKVSVVEPGFFLTNISKARKLAANRIADYDPLRERVLLQVQKEVNEGGDPTIVAKTIVEIVESPSPRLRYPVGREKRYLLLRKVLPQGMIESGVRRHWKIDAQ